MLHEYNLSLYFWAEAINTSCYIENKVFKRLILNKTSYKLLNKSKAKISYLRVFNKRIFNKRTLLAKESMHVAFDESNPFDPRKNFSSVDDIVDEFMDVSIQEKNASKPLELEGPSRRYLNLS